MSKRFIDTGIFEDSWFMELSKDGKLLWIYMITRCDHAGIIEINKRLLEVHTDIKNFEAIVEELGNRCIRLCEELGNSSSSVGEGLIYFIPKFIEFQYPGFPKSNVNQQVSALKQIKKYHLEKYLHASVPQEFMNSYGNGNGNGIGNGGKGGVGGKPKKAFIYPSRSDFFEYMDERGIPEDETFNEWSFFVKNDWCVGKGTHWGSWQDAADHAIAQYKQQKNGEF